jgi:hypothetical protein
MIDDFDFDFDFASARQQGEPDGGTMASSSFLSVK